VMWSQRVHWHGCNSEELVEQLLIALPAHIFGCNPNGRSVDSQASPPLKDFTSSVPGKDTCVPTVITMGLAPVHFALPSSERLSRFFKLS